MRSRWAGRLMNVAAVICLGTDVGSAGPWGRQHYICDRWVWFNAAHDAPPGVGEHVEYWVLFSGTDGLHVCHAVKVATDVDTIVDGVTDLGRWGASRRPNGFDHLAEPPRAWAGSGADPTFSPFYVGAAEAEYLPAEFVHAGFAISSWRFRNLGEWGRTDVYGAPAGVLAIVMCPLPLLAWARHRGRYRQRQRVSAGQCAACGYDVRSSTERCPECGTERPVAHRATSP
jgi:hypothetical protein